MRARARLQGYKIDTASRLRLHAQGIKELAQEGPQIALGAVISERHSALVRQHLRCEHIGRFQRLPVDYLQDLRHLRELEVKTCRRFSKSLRKTCNRHRR